VVLIFLPHYVATWRYGYNWKLSESEKNLLRTHTTAVSSRMLYKLAQSGFKPAKYFSVDRVFRNEAIDRTHLAEFHQIEGLVCDRGLTLGDLIGTLNTFFSRLGLKKLRFKPAYNPYTEPSMEIFRCDFVVSFPLWASEIYMFAGIEPRYTFSVVNLTDGVLIQLF
jgi:phenylalanyl-tRNA synthetase alpha subunit